MALSKGLKQTQVPYLLNFIRMIICLWLLVMKLARLKPYLLLVSKNQNSKNQNIKKQDSLF